MSQSPSPFDPGLAELPETLPIFPLPGVLLLPGGRLPLNIFEPRYLAMVRDALAGSRMIGMIQAVVEDEAEGFEVESGLDEDADAATPQAVREAEPQRNDPGSAPVYRVGCAGRIVAFSETDDGRYLITLKGLIRFCIKRELPMFHDYRQVVPDFASYAADLEPAPASFDRERMVEALRYYFEQQGIEADWEAIQKASNERLVTSLAMVCPFSTAEKQALLEAPNLSDRAETMTTILEMSVLGPGGGDAAASRH